MTTRHGARLVSVKEQVGGESASEIMMEGVLAAVAAGRRLEIAEDVRRGIRRKAQVGGTPFRAPIGYVSVSTIHDGREIRDVALDPDRAPLIQELFTLYASGDHSLDALSALTTARGLRWRPTPKLPPQPLQANGLSAILRNDYYLGTVVVNGVPLEGRHEPLVDLEVFATVQRLLSSRRHDGARAWKHHHYLAGSLFCGGCGRVCCTAKIQAAAVRFTSTSFASASSTGHAISRTTGWLTSKRLARTGTERLR